MSGAVAAAIAEKNVIQAFLDAGATSRGNSISAAEIGDINNRYFSRLQKQGVIIECDAGKWFLDENALSKVRQQRRNRAFALILVALVAVGLLYILFAGR